MLRKVSASIAKAPLFWALLIGIVGIVALDLASWAGVGMACLFLAGLCFVRCARRIAVIGLIALFLFAIRHQERLSEIQRFPFAQTVEQGNDVEIQGQAWVSDRMERKGNSLSGFLTITEISIGERTLPCRHKVPVWIQGKPLDLAYGEVVDFSGLLRPLEKPLAPGGFDPRTFYYRSQGSLARLEIRPGDALSPLDVPKRGPGLIHWARQSRDWMESALRYSLPESDDRYARVILAMALGARENSPEDLEENFRLSGTMHIFAVSGLHVGIIAALFLGLFRTLGISTRVSISLVIPLILFYALLTGFRPSAVRAALMASVFLSGFFFLQKPRLLNSLGAAGILILLYDSQQIFLPGFQLSFAVLCAIALLVQPFRDRLFAPLAIDPFLPRSLVSASRKLIDHFAYLVAAAIAISLVSWIGSAPLLVWHFDGISLVGVLANLFMIPFAAAIVSVAAFSVIAFGLKAVWIAGLLNKVNIGLTVVLTSLAGFFANLPGSFSHIDFGFSQAEQSPLQFEVMGRRGGSATMLSIRDESRRAEQNWLIDTGGESTYRQQVLPLLRSRGLNHLEGLILSHGDMAHIGAAPEVITRFSPGLVIESPLKNRSRIYPAIREAMEAQSLKPRRLGTGQVVQFPNRVECRILFPDATSANSLADDRTLVLKFSRGEFRILFTFDAGFAVTRHLLDSGQDLSADIWVRGQHSGSQSGLENLLKAIDPAAVISTNSNFPAHEKISEQFLRLLESSGMDLYDLSETGSVRISVSDKDFSVSPFLPTVPSKTYPWKGLPESQ